MLKKNTRDHYAKKSPGSKEVFNRQRKERNAARQKQNWTGGESVAEGGYFTRDYIIAEAIFGKELPSWPTTAS